MRFERERSRRTDPDSSRRAERAVRDSGAMRGQQLTCLELVKQYPGRSSKELAELGPLDRYQLARRLSDLRVMELVESREFANDDLRWYPR